MHAHSNHVRTAARLATQELKNLRREASHAIDHRSTEHVDMALLLALETALSALVDLERVEHAIVRDNYGDTQETIAIDRDRDDALDAIAYKSANDAQGSALELFRAMELDLW
jgi:hypothetical protein